MKYILALCLLASLPAAARPTSRLLSARISGEDGQPLAGVNISFQNQAARTISDQYGRFTLDVPEGALIVLNYAGCPTAVYTREEIEDEFKYRIVFHDHILLPEIVITDLRMEKCGFRSCPFPGSEHLTVSLQGRKWQYYPNPTRDAVSVFTEVAAGFIEVYAGNGLRVARIEVLDNQTLVNLARFPAGAYFLFYEYDKRVEPIGQVALIKG